MAPGGKPFFSDERYFVVSLSLAELLKIDFEQQHVEILNNKKWANLTPKFPMG
jgi:hypothetical protein